MNRVFVCARLCVSLAHPPFLLLIEFSHDATSQKEAEITKIQQKLPAKLWSSDVTTDRTISMRADHCSLDDFSSDSYVDIPEQVVVNGTSRCATLQDAPDTSETPEMPLQKAFGNDSSTCALCSDPFIDGDQVVESNNPLCNHCHHKACMNRWLQFQNTCPVCNHPYVVQTV